MSTPSLIVQTFNETLGEQENSECIFHEEQLQKWQKSYSKKIGHIQIYYSHEFINYITLNHENEEFINEYQNLDNDNIGYHEIELSNDEFIYSIKALTKCDEPGIKAIQFQTNLKEQWVNYSDEFDTNSQQYKVQVQNFLQDQRNELPLGSLSFKSFYNNNLQYEVIEEIELTFFDFKAYQTLLKQNQQLLLTDNKNSQSNEQNNQQLMLQEKNDEISNIKYKQVDQQMQIYEKMRNVKEFTNFTEDINKLNKQMKQFRSSIPIHEKFVNAKKEFGQLENDFNDFYNHLMSLEIKIHEVSNEFNLISKKINQIVKISGKPSETFFIQNVDDLKKLLNELKVLKDLTQSKAKEFTTKINSMEYKDVVNNMHQSEVGNDDTYKKNQLRLKGLITEIRNKEELLIDKIKHKELELNIALAELQNFQNKIESLEKSIESLDEKLKCLDNYKKELETNQQQDIKKKLQSTQDLDEDLKSQIKEKGLKISKMEQEQFQVNKNLQEKYVLARSLIQDKIQNIKFCKPRFHYILILDESGSMQGQKWNCLTNSTESFIQQKSAQNNEDLISIILFDTNVRVIVEKQAIKNLKNFQLPNMNSGGTNFAKAFAKLQQLLQLNQPGYIPVSIFLTDGVGGTGYSIYLEQIYKQYQKDNYFFIAIGLGADYNQNELDSICTKANGGSNIITLNDAKFFAKRDVRDADKLIQIFDDIIKFSSQDFTQFKAQSETLTNEHKSLLSILQEQQLQEINKVKIEIEQLIQQRKIIACSSTQSAEDYKKQILEFQQNTESKYQELQQNQAELIRQLDDIKKQFNACASQKETKLKEIQLIKEEHKQQIDLIIGEKDQLFQQIKQEQTGEKAFLDAWKFKGRNHYEEFLEKFESIQNYSIQFNNFCKSLVKFSSNLETEIKQVLQILENPNYLKDVSQQESQSRRIIAYYSKLGLDVTIDQKSKAILQIAQFVETNEKTFKQNQEAYQFLADRGFVQISLVEFCEKDSKALEKYIDQMFDKYKDSKKNQGCNFEEQITDIGNKIKDIEEDQIQSLESDYEQKFKDIDQKIEQVQNDYDSDQINKEEKNKQTNELKKQKDSIKAQLSIKKDELKQKKEKLKNEQSKLKDADKTFNNQFKPFQASLNHAVEILYQAFKTAYQIEIQHLAILPLVSVVSNLATQSLPIMQLFNDELKKIKN